MLKLIFCVCFVAFFSAIYCYEQIAYVNVTLMREGQETVCKVEKPSYNLIMGTTVHINIFNKIQSYPRESYYTINVTENSIYNGFHKFFEIVSVQSKNYTIKDSYTDYQLKFNFNWGGTDKTCITSIHYDVPAKADPFIESRNEMILFTVIGILLVIIIIAETALILYCRSKFKALTRHSNLTRLKEEDENDGDRYSTNPKKRDKKLLPVIPVDNRQSEIYEEPNIIIGAPPPLPPGIPTSRSDHSNTSTLKMPPSPQSNGTSYPTFPRSKNPIREPLPISVADRPPLPLPDEFYSVAEEHADDDVYEQPPILQPQQTKQSIPPFLSPQQLRLPQKPIPQQTQFPLAQKPIPPPPKPLNLPQKQYPPPQKQEPTQNQLSQPKKQIPSPQKQIPSPQKQEPHPQKPSSFKNPNSQTRAIQEKLAMKLQLDKPVKPPISQAKPTPPRNKTTVPAASRVPSQPTVFPSTAPAPKPQPTVKLVSKPPASKPKTPPVSPTTLEQQVHFFNQHRDELPHNNSSDDDDEWTYEPLYNM